MAEERLQKVLAAAGVASRRACEDLIAQGRVTVNGRTATIGDKVDRERDAVALDGERVNVDPALVHIALNKPRGVITTVDDPQGRPTVADLVNLQQRVFPVGRLDQDTEGLLLLTNDGELTNRLLHPSSQVERVYVALVSGQVRNRDLARLRQGVALEDGPARARRARVLEEQRGRALVELVMTEGRKREVRRMLGAIDLRVERLARVAFGGVEIGELRQGKWRFLTHPEIGRLHAAAAAGDESTERSDDMSTERHGRPSQRRAGGGTR